MGLSEEGVDVVEDMAVEESSLFRSPLMTWTRSWTTIMQTPCRLETSADELFLFFVFTRLDHAIWRLFILCFSVFMFLNFIIRSHQLCIYVLGPEEDVLTGQPVELRRIMRRLPHLQIMCLLGTREDCSTNYESLEIE